MRVRLIPLSLITSSLLSLAAALSATATAGAQQTAAAAGAPAVTGAGPQAAPPCDRTDQDRSKTPHLPLYQGCAVDVQATPPVDAVRPNFEPDRRTAFCYSAMLEVAVDTAGVPEMQTLRVVRATHPNFARAVSRMVPTMRFQPARLGGAPVRQLVPIGTVLASGEPSC